jgi:hypothetical protein
MALPSNISYGQIVHRMVLAVGDGGDADRLPDAVPMAGAQISFTPSVAWLLNASAVPPVTIYPQRIVCTTDADGYLVDPMGEQGVWLIATDDPDTNPTNFTYAVEIRVNGLATRTFNISVPGGVTTDLTSVMPVSTSPGSVNVVGPQGPAGPQGEPGPALVADPDYSGLYLIEDESTDRVVAVGDDFLLPVEVRAGLSGPVRELSGLKRALLDAQYSCAVQVLGDSTGVSTDRWPYRLAQKIATDYPAWTVQHINWDEATEDYAAPVTISTGTAGALHTVSTAGVYPRTIINSHAPHLTGTMDVRAKLNCVTWTPANVFGATIFLSEGGGTGSWGWNFSINTAGVLRMYYSVDGTTLGSMSANAVVGFAANSTWWVRCVFTPDDGAGNRVAKFYKSTDGLTWTQIGTTVTTVGTVVVKDQIALGKTYLLGETGASTGNGVTIYEVDVRDGLNGPSILPRRPDLWAEYGAGPGTPETQIVGAPVLTMVNGSRSGGTVAYLNETTRRKMLTPDYGQLVTFLSSSHNETRAGGNDWAAIYKAWVDGVRTRIAAGSIIGLTQNPEAPGNFYTMAHAKRRLGLLALAPPLGIGTIDIMKAFYDYGPTWATALLGDLTHPNSAGSILWMNTIYKALQAV